MKIKKGFNTAVCQFPQQKTVPPMPRATAPKGSDFEKEFIKVWNELKAFAEPEDSKWEGNVDHYEILWDCISKRLDYSSVKFIRGTGLYFESKEKIEAAIAAVGENRVKKYYLGIKED